MADKKGTGLLMVWADIPADKEEDFNNWYNTEHLAELLSLPGVLNAARYEAVSSGPKHLACYELENAAVMESEQFKSLKRTEWGSRVSPSIIGTNYISNTYEMAHPSWDGDRSKCKEFINIMNRKEYFHIIALYILG